MVKCSECGFLGLRRGDGELIEVDYQYRTKGERDVLRPPTWYVPRRIGDTTPQTPAIELIDEDAPRCLVRPAVDFRERVGANVDRAGIALALQDPWECPKFYEWQPGRSPKDHLAEMDRQRVLDREDRRDNEMRQREDERDETLSKAESARRVEDRWWHVAELVVLGLVVAAATILSGFIASR